jgi:spore coat protein U-like protein
MSRIPLLTCLLLAACFGSVAAFADPDSTTMPVVVRVLPVASVAATPLDFGPFARNSGTVSGNATIMVNVSSGVPYNIVINAGMHYSQTWRNVENSGSLIQYALFEESGDEWGDGDFDGTYPRGRSVAGVGTGAVQIYLVRGELYVSTLPANSPSGAYLDVVNVTVYY